MIDFSQLDKVIHEKGRLSIMTLLTARSPRAFQDLKAELGMSDGNLVTHLRTLSKEGYVRELKSTAVDSGRSLTTYEVTGAGKGAFKAYLNVLEAIVKASKPG
ncbi:ArsR family transcriptional regulator [Phragmitibacter flavus]|uniref:ArsR family transcriptional regulator n=1 Tax=Phragmitibacter flavus TaxID=2576071 RepID=A0A5R8KHR2_9BACT|nr:transcriptional regulator [Phragmitibacter flavus]TLD71856.1 ArsR family transcriptional regulator [Phragmitibacter flavus]